MRRDFTYIDDVVEAVVRLVKLPPSPSSSGAEQASSPATSQAPWRIYNVGNSQPVELTDLIAVMEKVIGKAARRELLPMRPVDVLETCADSSDLEAAVGFRPRVRIEDGVTAFVKWYRDFRAAAFPGLPADSK